MAGPGELIVSGTVTDLVVGSGIDFEDRGERELRGVPGRWRVDVPGGTLEVSRDESGHVHLAGPAVIVARGETDR